MTNELEKNVVDTTEPTETEAIRQTLSDLKAQADRLGITYPRTAGVAKMLELIKTKEEELAKLGNRQIENITAQSAKVTLYNGKTLSQLRDEAFKLVRIRLVVNNPAKINRDGQWITAGNARVGTIKRYVPFKPEAYADGWHVEAVVLERLKQMKHQRFPKHKSKENAAMDDYNNATLVNDFTIEILPPLTKEELEELALRQAREGSLKD